MPQRIGPLRGFRAACAWHGWRPILPCLLLLQALGGAASAQERRGLRDMRLDLDSRVPSGALQVEPKLRLDGVMPGELLAGGSARAIAAATSWRQGLPSAGTFELDTRVVRSVPAVWRMRVEDLDAAAELSVRCEIAAGDGEANALSHGDDPRSVIRVWVRPLPPQVVEHASDDGVVIEGGLVLDMDLRNVRRAGTHTGTLTVTVEHY